MGTVVLTNLGIGMYHLQSFLLICLQILGADPRPGSLQPAACRSCRDAIYKARHWPFIRLQSPKFDQ